MASTTQAVSAYSPDTCMFCHQTLSITVGADTNSESEHPLEREEVIDDVELYCGPSGSGPGGHHAHWTCLVDHAIQTRTRSAVPVFPAVTTCAVCGQNVLHSSGRFIVDVRNEGGETKRFDFGVIIVRSLSSPFLFFPSCCPSIERNNADSNRTCTSPPIHLTILSKLFQIRILHLRPATLNRKKNYT